MSICELRFEIINWKSGRILRAYPNNLIYCGRLQSTMESVVGQKRPQRGVNHASGHFRRVRLGLELFARPHNDEVIRIGS